MATDLAIQNTIKEVFADRTVLTIAHRLNTIIESDRVLVMDAGSVLEFDEPSKLLETEGGSFRDLCLQAGSSSFAKLTAQAKAAQEVRDQKKSL
jgi:ABC-type multidrug transport system fused ATPase/permease subunit